MKSVKRLKIMEALFFNVPKDDPPPDDPPDGGGDDGGD
jgi:hypothetical protein